PRADRGSFPPSHAWSHLESITNGDAVLTRIAEPRVQLVREVGRLVAEVEAAHEVALVEDVAAPERRAPAPPIAADLQVRARVRTRLDVVAVVVEERAHAAQIHASEPARRHAVLGAEGERVRRRVRLLAALE